MNTNRLPIYCGLAIFYGLGLTWRSAYGVGGGILLLSALFLLGKDFLPQDREEKQWIGYFVLIFLCFALPSLIHQAEMREYDRFSRLLGVIPIFLLLRRIPISISFWAITLSFGAVIASCFALHSYLAGVERFGGEHNPIQFGDLSLLTGFLALIGYQQGKTWRCFCVILGFLAGIIASLLSGSRGGWIALLPMGIFLSVYFFRQQQKKVIFGGFIALVIIILFLFPTISKRFLEMRQDLIAFSLGNSNSSIGLRLEMWRLAGQLFVEKPLFGWGSASLENALDASLLVHHIPAAIRHGLNHLHNDFLDTAARLGLVGLSGLLLLYWLPLRHFFQQWQRGSYQAGIGMVFCLSFMLFSLSQSIFQHHSGIIFYLITFSVLFTQQERKTLNY